MISKAILKQHACHGMTEDDLYGAYKIFFGTMVSESRLKILNLLQKGKKNVSEIVDALGLEQTAVSHDLARMKRCGFVLVSQEGKYRYYSLNHTTIEPILKLIETHMSQHCVHILHAEEGNHEKQ